MSVQLWASLLTELQASWTRYVEGDFGEGGYSEEITPEFVCYGRKLPSKEKIAAGIEAATIAYKLYADAPLHESVTEAAKLTLIHEGDNLGTFNIRSVSDVLPDGGVEIDVDRLSTA